LSPEAARFPGTPRSISLPNLRQIARGCFLSRQGAKNLINSMTAGCDEASMALREQERLRVNGETPGRDDIKSYLAVKKLNAKAPSASPGRYRRRRHCACMAPFLLTFVGAVGRAVASKEPALQTEGRAKPRMRLN
jgi:hypothetical protein